MNYHDKLDLIVKLPQHTLTKKWNSAAHLSKVMVSKNIRLKIRRKSKAILIDSLGGSQS